MPDSNPDQIPRNEPLWQIALFRFLEVSWGILVALGIQWGVVWCERRFFSSTPAA
jgi:hypothetical protein